LHGEGAGPSPEAPTPPVFQDGSKKMGFMKALVLEEKAVFAVEHGKQHIRRDLAKAQKSGVFWAHPDFSGRAVRPVPKRLSQVQRRKAFPPLDGKALGLPGHFQVQGVGERWVVHKVELKGRSASQPSLTQASKEAFGESLQVSLVGLRGNLELEAPA